jgi:hypothetical protein
MRTISESSTDFKDTTISRLNHELHGNGVAHSPESLKPEILCLATEAVEEHGVVEPQVRKNHSASEALHKSQKEQPIHEVQADISCRCARCSPWLLFLVFHLHPLRLCSG